MHHDFIWLWLAGGNMGLLDKIRGEFIDIIEWTEPSDSGLLAYRFPRYNNEIKIGAKLTVREGQNAVFVNEGQIADVFQPGMYELSTQNLPILSTLKGWIYGFNSPFKAEVYFISVKQQTGHKWGTSNPLIKRDPDFGIVRLRAHGSYVFRVRDSAKFLKELVATDPSFEDYEIDSQLKQVIVSEFAQVIGQSKVPLLDLLSSYEQLAEYVHRGARDDFESWGLELSKFYISNISVPPEVESAMDRRTALGAVGDLTKYAQFQSAEALRDAAKNEGGLAGAGVGLGAGLVMSQQMLGAVQQPALASPLTAAMPTLPTNQQFHVALNGQPTGPFGLSEIQRLISLGKINSSTLLWQPGLANWTKAQDIPELKSLFSPLPPPLPK